MLGKGRTFRNLRKLDLLVNVRCNALGVALDRSTSDLEREVLDGIVDLAAASSGVVLAFSLITASLIYRPPKGSHQRLHAFLVPTSAKQEALQNHTSGFQLLIPFVQSCMMLPS